jgi:MFS superfamily sulfate permease-like transporter
MSDSHPPFVPGRIPRDALRSSVIGWVRWIPGLQTIRTYEVKWLWHDIVAGLVLTSVLVPVGIAYAVASGVPAICGLYATIVGLLVYAVAGPSRILVLGPDSSLVTLVLAVTLPLSKGDPERAIALAGMMALVSGAFCFVAGLARLGFITDLLSKPIRYGYMNGIALTVLVSQLPATLGVSPGPHGMFNELLSVFRAVLAGDLNWVSLSLGAGTFVVVLALKRSRVVPGALTAVVCATMVVAVFDLAARAGVVVLGPLPQGLPGIAFPWAISTDFAPVLFGGVAVALVSFADTSVLSRAYAARSVHDFA